MAFGDFTVVRSTVKNVTNASNILEEVPINTPAFEFNFDGSFKGLLVEPGATNLLTYSQAFDDASWIKTRLNTTGTPAWVNVGAVTPNNTVTSEKIIPTTENGTHHIAKSVASGAYTFSVYARAGEETVMSLWLRSDSVRAEFNLANGTITTSTVTSSAIQAIGSGWYRCSVYDSTPGTTASIYARSGGAFIGNNTDGFFIWQAQLETGAVATSPIYTVGSTVTRTADDISLASASSLIGQTEGTIYAEVFYPDLSNAGSKSAYVYFTSGSFDNAIIIGREPGSPSGYVFYIIASGVTVLVDATSALQNNSVKLALAYKSGDYSAYLNGTLVVTGSTAFTFGATLSKIGIGQNSGDFATIAGVSSVRSVALFPTRLSNAQLASLTTL
jgi:hypothetical protein